MSKRMTNRFRQYNEILANGSACEIACSFCARNDRQCIMDSKSKNCAACTRSNRKCVREFHSESEWRKIDRERKRLAEDFKAAEEASVRAAEAASQAFAWVARLRKQRQFLEDRHTRMSVHDSNLLAVLDEEDPPGEEEIAEFERMLAEQEQSKQLAATAEALSPSFWADCDRLLGENPVTGAGSSSGS